MSDAEPNTSSKPEAESEHLNIKVTDGNNEVFFKIKRSTQLKKLMDAFCDRQGKAPASIRFLFDGSRVSGTDSPHTVSIIQTFLHFTCPSIAAPLWHRGCSFKRRSRDGRKIQ